MGRKEKVAVIHVAKGYLNREDVCNMNNIRRIYNSLPWILQEDVLERFENCMTAQDKLSAIKQTLEHQQKVAKVKISMGVTHIQDMKTQEATEGSCRISEVAAEQSVGCKGKVHPKKLSSKC